MLMASLSVVCAVQVSAGPFINGVSIWANGAHFKCVTSTPNTQQLETRLGCQSVKQEADKNGKES